MKSFWSSFHGKLFSLRAVFDANSSDFENLACHTFVDAGRHFLALSWPWFSSQWSWLTAENFYILSQVSLWASSVGMPWVQLMLTHILGFLPCWKPSNRNMGHLYINAIPASVFAIIAFVNEGLMPARRFGQPFFSVDAVRLRRLAVCMTAKSICGHHS